MSDTLRRNSISAARILKSVHRDTSLTSSSRENELTHSRDARCDIEFPRFEKRCRNARDNRCAKSEKVDDAVTGVRASTHSAPLLIEKRNDE